MRLDEHVRRCFPAFSARHDEDARLGFIREVAGEAARYGLQTERSIAKFINLAVVLGADFHRRLPWAREILQGDHVSVCLSKIDHLCETARRVTDP